MGGRHYFSVAAPLQGLNILGLAFNSPESAAPPPSRWIEPENICQAVRWGEGREEEEGGVEKLPGPICPVCTLAANGN